MLRWNIIEFCLYFLFVFVSLILYLLDIIQNITVPSVFFSVFIGIFLIRFFQEIEKLNKIAELLNTLHYSFRVWEGLKTLSKQWAGQLVWLQLQASGHKKIGKPSRFLFPHKFHDIPIELINELPNKKADMNFLGLKGSLISIHHKIDSLNFMIEKIHLREEITDPEMNEIKNLLYGNKTSTIPTLSEEIPQAKKDIEMKLTKLGYCIKD